MEHSNGLNVGDETRKHEDATKHEGELAEDEDEEDFMSDAVLARVIAASTQADSSPTTYTAKRRKLQHAQECTLAEQRARSESGSTRAERERAARRAALGTNLIEVALAQEPRRGQASEGQGDGARSRSNDRRGTRKRSASASPAREPASERLTSDADAGRGQVNAPKVTPATSNAALRMMLDLGYEHGQALGAARIQDDVDDAGGACEDEAGTSKAKPARDRPVTEPLAVDDRWLGVDRRARGSREGDDARARQVGPARYGLGSAAVQRGRDPGPAHTPGLGNAQAISNSSNSTKQSEQLAHASLAAFRTRQADEGRQRHAEALLRNARATCEELDRKAGVEYNVLWLDPHWLTPGARLSEDQTELMDRALNVDDGEPNADQAEEEHAADRRAEALAFCSLDPISRLKETTAHLRSAYHYCLFCGCSYDNAQELATQCPGEDEDDH